MAVGELVGYLREHLALGYSLDELKLQLVRYGHSSSAVNEAVSVLKKEALDSLPSPSVPGTMAMPSTAHVWLLAPAVLFMLLFSIGIIVALLRNPVV